MSGGRFDHTQYQIGRIADNIQSEIDRQKKRKGKENDDIYEAPKYSSKTIEEFKEGIRFLRIAEIYANRIDWLISGDDGEETFHERLKEDLLPFDYD